MTSSSFAAQALEALRARFTAGELRVVAGLPYPTALREARERRARALVASRGQETPESEREVPVIKAMHAFIVEQEERLSPTTSFAPWDGALA